MRKHSLDIVGVVIVFCFIFVLLYITNHNLNGNGNSYENVTENQSEDNDDKKDSISISEQEREITQRERLDNIKKALSERLGVTEEYLRLNNSDKSTNDFVDWISQEYGNEILEELDRASDDELTKIIYEKAGKSVYILMDEFMDIKSYSSMNHASTGVNIMFAGDICLAEDGFVLDYFDTTTGLSECISPSIISMTNEADIFMINNEFCISDRGTPLNGKYYTFRAMPSRVDILKELGTDIVSFANNHVYDYGPDAFADTVRYIDEAGIKYVGGGNNVSEAEKIIYFESDGIKIGFISASRAEKIRYTPQATEERPGIFLMYDPERFFEIAKDTAKRCDYLIAYIHWGTEDSKYYEDYQHDLAAQMFDIGIDAIIGAHPHVLQGIEYINAKPVIYSLGDFWFNGETKYTALINMNIGIDGLNGMNIIPCLQSNYTTSRIEDNEEKAAFMQYLRELSAGCNISENGDIKSEN